MNQEGREELLFHQPQPLDDCCPSALWSPASQELEAVLQTNSTNDDCIKLQSPFGDGDYCLLDENEVSTCDEDETVCDVFPQLCGLPKENLDSLLPPPQLQDHRPSILQSPIYTKLGNDLHPLQPQDYQSSILRSQYTRSWEMFHMLISILVNTIIGNLHLRKKFQPMKLTYQLDISCLILKIKLQIIGF